MLKLHQALKSSRAAIDLASIMVGIIVIGLIGGVIAATVFAVIPWAQNNAAKQQLDSVVAAESSYRGLSADKDTNLQNAVSSPTSQSDPNQVVLNSTFTGSAGLAVNNLLTTNPNGLYCVIATTDGKDYHAYSKSGSGQWYYATSGKTQPTEYTGSTPCVTTGAAAGTVNPVVDGGTGAVPTTPTAGGGSTTPTPGTGSGTTPTPEPTVNPGPTVISTYDFEDGTVQGFTPNLYPSGASLSATTPAHSGSYSLRYFSPAPSDDATRTVSRSVSGIIAGQTYRVTAWMYWSPEQTGLASVDMSAFGNSSYATLKGSSPTPAVNKWTQVTYEVVAKSSSGKVNSSLNFSSYNRAYYKNTFYVDDITVEKIS
jgi:hypothetical protein